jgi:hypothetical protein
MPQGWWRLLEVAILGYAVPQKSPWQLEGSMSGLNRKAVAQWHRKVWAHDDVLVSEIELNIYKQNCCEPKSEDTNRCNVEFQDGISVHVGRESQYSSEVDYNPLQGTCVFGLPESRLT